GMERQSGAQSPAAGERRTRRAAAGVRRRATARRACAAAVAAGGCGLRPARWCATMSAQCTLSAPGMAAGRASPHDVAAVLLQWFDRHGRHDLPWQHPRSAYRVWVSEIMLQQTQVQVVLGYFERFMQQLPTLPLLAAASEDQVMALWSGLG